MQQIDKMTNIATRIRFTLLTYLFDLESFYTSCYYSNSKVFFLQEMMQDESLVLEKDPVQTFSFSILLMQLMQQNV